MPGTNPPAPVESLVAGRTRRANAGNLLAKLLTQEADDEDTLFLSDEDDVEFEDRPATRRADDDDDDADDDAMMDSDDDSDDEGPPAPDAKPELEGELALQVAEKAAKKARKRKADDAFLKPKKKTAGVALKRRVTIREEREERERLGTPPPPTPEEESDHNALTRPRKKSERISWVPEFVATRASSRTLSLQNRSETMRRLEESEKRRLHTIALMEKAAAKKDKVRPKKEMTQEERLAEARITERRNKKSLCSWEETEAAKLEEQRQRIAALQNRKLAGPVVTYWSGKAEWSGETGRLVRVGRGPLVEELPREETTPVKKKKTRKQREKERDEREMEERAKLEEKANIPEEKANIIPPPAPPSTEDQKPIIPSDPSPTPAAVTMPAPTSQPPPTLPPKQEPPTTTTTLIHSLPPAPPLPLPTKPTTPSTRTLIILENFTTPPIRDKPSLTKALWGDQPRRLPTTKPVCVISQKPAKFCDPATGMPFSSLHAYREIRRLLHGEIRWSYLLGAYVGEAKGGGAARGVPEGF